MRRQIGHLTQRHGPDLSMLNPMMTGFGRRTVAVVEVRPLGALCLLKKGFHGVVKRPLIAFERQNIVPLLRPDLGRNVPLGAHGIQGDNRPLKIQTTIPGHRTHGLFSRRIGFNGDHIVDSREHRQNRNGYDIHQQVLRLSFHTRVFQGLKPLN
jgi:hypothetical protein